MKQEICNLCKHEHPFTSEYFVCRKGKPYRRCKDCDREYKRIKALEYRAKDPQHHREILKKSRDHRREEVRAQDRQYYRENIEYYRERGRTDYWKNRDRILTRHHSKYVANPELHRQKSREWRKNNPDKAKILWQNSRYKRQGIPGKHTVSDIKYQYQNQNGLCYWCNRSLNGTFQVDHVIPVSRGGSNDPQNLVCSCQPCNASKSARLPYIEWIPPFLTLSIGP